MRDRRLATAAALACVLAAAAARGNGETAEGGDMSAGANAGPAIPAHLPKRLAISSWIWSWVSFALPEEPYGDLEKCVAGLKERGFNAVRVDAGLNWCFRPDGSPRGEMAFGPWAAGASGNLSTVNHKGGGRHDVLKRVVRLMELAKQYDVYVILTSWEYQDSTWTVADEKIRAEVYGIPERDRLRHLARQHERLLKVLKEKGLEKHVAFVEVHNEIEYSEFPKGAEGRGPAPGGGGVAACGAPGRAGGGGLREPRPEHRAGQHPGLRPAHVLGRGDVLREPVQPDGDARRLRSEGAARCRCSGGCSRRTSCRGTRA